MAEKDKVQRYGKCLIEREIGRGARSIVHLAWHEGLQIPVAVKVMRKIAGDNEDQFSERFMREARIAAQLSHTNIVRVYDCGETEESYYLVLEYIEGESCKQKMEQWGAFDWQRAVQIVREVANALKYALKKGVIHRDLKPENIMIDTEGNARITDLGLAKEVLPGRASATADGDVLGTPYYMSPEQVKQPSDVDFRSDIYSLGATLYHMATGEVPFEAPTPFEIMTKHLNEPLTPPSEKRSDLPEALCDIIERTMAKRPEERYGSYEELIKELDGLLVGGGARDDEATSLGLEVVLEEAVPPKRALADLTKTKTPLRPRVRPAPRPIRPVELPVMSQNVRAKIWGVLAMLAFAFFLVCLYQTVLVATEGTAALLVLIGTLGLAGGGSYLMLRLGDRRHRESVEGLEEQVSAVLGRLCERLNLSMPWVHLSARRGNAAFAYRFFGRKASIHLPGGWLRAVQLGEEQTEAYLAHALASVYNGDADIRMILAAPLELLKTVAWLVEGLLGSLHSMGSTLRVKAAQVLAMVALAGICTVSALLFFGSIWAGLLGLLFAGLLLLVAAFERSSCFAADSFAARVLGRDEPVVSLVALSGLASLEGYWLLRESGGPAAAEKWLDTDPEERGQLSDGISAHYSEVPYWPDMMEMARKAFSWLPFASYRLNRLAGLPGDSSSVVRLVTRLREVYAGLLGASQRTMTHMLDLAQVGFYAAAGAVGGLVAVAVVLVVVHQGGQRFLGFLGTLVVLGTALGFVVAPRLCRGGFSAGRFGWAMTVAAVFSSCTMMLGFCMAGKGVSDLALQLPTSFMLVLLFASLAGALFVRMSPLLGIEVRTAGYAGSKTAHTQVMLLADEDRPRRQKPAKGRSSQDTDTQY